MYELLQTNSTASGESRPFGTPVAAGVSRDSQSPRSSTEKAMCVHRKIVGRSTEHCELYWLEEVPCRNDSQDRSIFEKLNRISKSMKRRPGPRVSRSDIKMSISLRMVYIQYHSNQNDSMLVLKLISNEEKNKNIQIDLNGRPGRKNAYDRRH